MERRRGGVLCKWRMDTVNGDHFFTSNPEEVYEYLGKFGWRLEGVGFVAPTSGSRVYRLYNSNSGEHIYTIGEKEKNNRVQAGWKYESEITPFYK